MRRAQFLVWNVKLVFVDFSYKDRDTVDNLEVLLYLCASASQCRRQFAWPGSDDLRWPVAMM